MISVIEVIQFDSIKDLPKSETQHVYSRTFPVICKAKAAHHAIIAKAVKREFNKMAWKINNLMYNPKRYFGELR